MVNTFLKTDEQILLFRIKADLAVIVKKVFLFFEKCSKISGNGTGSRNAAGAYPDPGGCSVEVWVAALASFGVFCVLWTVFGWLLSGGSGTVVCVGEPAGAVLLARRLRLLRELGLFRGRLVLLSDEKNAKEGIGLSNVETVTPGELIRRIELGAEEFGTAGDGDPSGHRVGGGLSEL